MYALLHNNQIKVGPRQYSYAFFKQYLTEQNIQTDIPFEYNKLDSITITKDITIIKVIEPLIPSHNSLTEQLAGPFYDLTVEPITGIYNVVDRELTAAKNDLISRVAVKRYEKETAGTTITVQNKELKVDTARDARHIWFQSLMLLPNGSTQKFKFDGGIWLELTKADIEMIVASIVGHVQGAFDWEAAKVIEIEGTTDKAGLESIVVE